MCTQAILPMLGKNYTIPAESGPRRGTDKLFISGELHGGWGMALEVRFKSRREQNTPDNLRREGNMHGGIELVFDGGETTDWGRGRGAINEALERVESQAGAWSDDRNARIEGVVRETTAKAQEASCNAKHAARNASNVTSIEEGISGAKRSRAERSRR